MEKLKLNDDVIVLAGKDKGKTGKLVALNKKRKKVIVQGVNVIKKSMKPTQENPDGGFVEVERPLDVSNIAVVSPKTNGATRVRIETKDGKKVRVAIKCGSVLS